VGTGQKTVSSRRVPPLPSSPLPPSMLLGREAVEDPLPTMTASKVVGLLRAGGGSSLVAEKGARTLKELSSAPHKCRACVSSGAVPVLVAMLGVHDGVPAVALNASWALSNLADCNPAGVEACIESSAVPALLAMLGLHCSLLGVVQCACLALYHLSCSPAGQQACIAAGAPVAIVSSLRAHAAVPSLVELSCRVLGNISLLPEGKVACLAAEAVPAMVAALSAHASVSTVAQYACGVLSSIAMGMVGNEEACVAAGVVPAIVGTLAQHASVAAVAGWACMALRNIAAVPVGQAACVSNGAAPALVATLSAHPGLPAVAEHACGALTNIACYAAGKEACIAAGSAPALVAALRAHGSAGAVAELAILALSSLIASPAGREAAVAAGAVPAFASILKALSANVKETIPWVASCACKALLSIGSSSSQHRAAVVATGAVALHPSLTELGEGAQKVLKELHPSIFRMCVCVCVCVQSLPLQCSPSLSLPSTHHCLHARLLALQTKEKEWCLIYWPAVGRRETYRGGGGYCRPARRHVPAYKARGCGAYPKFIAKQEGKFHPPSKGKGNGPLSLLRPPVPHCPTAPATPQWLGRGSAAPGGLWCGEPEVIHEVLGLCSGWLACWASKLIITCQARHEPRGRPRAC
jgi:hypothetical protein